MNEFEKKLKECVAARDTFIKVVDQMEAILEEAECKTLMDKKTFEDLMKTFDNDMNKAVDKLRMLELRNRDNF